MEFISTSPIETYNYGKNFAKKLKPGDVVILVGELGTGKTEFSKGVCAEFGILENVTSPTFTLISEYTSGNIPVYHFDLYRIEKENELEEIGFESYLNNDGILLIEWGNKFPKILPKEKIEIYFKHGKSENERIILINKDDISD